MEIILLISRIQQDDLAINLCDVDQSLKDIWKPVPEVSPTTAVNISTIDSSLLLWLWADDRSIEHPSSIRGMYGDRSCGIRRPLLVYIAQIKADGHSRSRKICTDESDE